MRYWWSPSRMVVECLLLLVLSLLLPAQPLAQIAVITALKGQATTTRVARQIPSNVGDDIYVGDRLATERDSLLCVLIGGKVVVTLWEVSNMAITEEPSRGIVDLGVGRLAVRLFPRLIAGQSVAVHTPNVVAVLGTDAIITTHRDPEVVTTVLNLGASAVTVCDRGNPSQCVDLHTKQTVTSTGPAGKTTHTAVGDFFLDEPTRLATRDAGFCCGASRDADLCTGSR